MLKKRRSIGVFLLAAVLAGCGEQAPTDGSAGGGQEQTGGGTQERAEGDSGTQQENSSGEGVTAVPLLWEAHKAEELIDSDFLFYRVNCGGPAEGDTDLGFYQSAADREYGEDPVTGRSWGYRQQDYMEAQEDDQGEGITGWRWGIREGTEYDSEETGFYYDFELPSGEYEVTLGFFNPFSARAVTVDMEGSTVVEGEKILKYRLTEAAVTQAVTDGQLEIKVYNPERGKDPMKDPILSYIEIRAVPEYDKALLALYLERTAVEEEQVQSYTEQSRQAYLEAREAALAASEEAAPEYEEICQTLKKAYENLEEIMVYSSFINGQPWTDDQGNLIQAHGGQVQKLPVFDSETGESLGEKWWWVGEDKSAGYRGGIRAYSSDDLYNWHFEGVIMRNVESREALDTDPYFQELYADASEEELDHIYQCLSGETAVIERPKMLYNEKTGMYVLWFHADGPTAESDSNYAAASAGVAVSESPNGPFRFIDRYRLNTCPEDQEDFYPQSKGMARDMNLFVDEDGTGYIIYSSEENLTLYISRLNDSYTYLAVDPEEAVYGRDYIRLFPGAQREAPALFLREGVYYLVTSGCTGWAPNQARYYKADSVLGEWVNCGDPCVGDDKMTTFDSQSTCVFLADEESGKYIYMGDRWNSEDLANSRYIWLPAEFDEEGNLSLSYQDEWSLKD